MMIMMKLKFINSLKDEREREEDTVETTVTEVMIFELSELLVHAETKISLSLTKVMMKIMKQD
jgi:hypothetical protein